MADAPKILDTDYLDEAYPKINKAIDNANDAINKHKATDLKADQAVSNSNIANATATNSLTLANQAKETASLAKTKTDGFQNQLDELVLDGDSSVEAAQARVREVGTETTTFNTLQARLNDGDAQLEKTKININALPNNTFLLAKFYEKVNKQEKVIISCRGDSVVYGQTGETSAGDNRDPLPGHTHVRAGTSWPETLQTVLRSIYGELRVDVINRGYSGDTVTKSLQRWATPIGSDITFIALGINDRTLGIQTYITDYRKIIMQELSWNSAIVLLTPTKTGTGSDTNLESYRNAVEKLAREFNCPVINCLDMLKNYSAVEIMPDWTHFNTAGYDIIGKRVAASILSDSLIKINKVSSGDYLLARTNIDKTSRYGNGAVDIIENAQGITPPEGNLPRYFKMNQFSRLTYNFETTHDNVVAIPLMKIEGYASVQLDFGCKQPYNSSNLRSVDNPSTISLGAMDTTDMLDRVNIDNYKQYGLVIPTKGAHSITFLNDVIQATYVYGIAFISFDSILAKSQTRRITSIPNTGRFVKGDIYHYSTFSAGGYIGCAVTAGGKFGGADSGLKATISQQWSSGIVVDKKGELRVGDRITVDGNTRTFEITNLYPLANGTYQLEVTPNTGGDTLITSGVLRFANPLIKQFGLLES